MCVCDTRERESGQVSQTNQWSLPNADPDTRTYAAQVPTCACSLEWQVKVHPIHTHTAHPAPHESLHAIQGSVESCLKLCAKHSKFLTYSYNYFYFNIQKTLLLTCLLAKTSNAASLSSSSLSILKSSSLASPIRSLSLLSTTKIKPKSEWVGMEQSHDSHMTTSWSLYIIEPLHASGR